jgi:hypothetical protein
MFSNGYNWFAWFFGWIRLKVPMQQRTKLSLRSQFLRWMIRMKEMKMRNGIMGENAYWLCLDILDVGSMFFWLYINILKRIRVWRWLIDGNHRPILIYWDFGFGVCITFWHGLLEFWSKCSKCITLYTSGLQLCNPNMKKCHFLSLIVCLISYAIRTNCFCI